MTTSTNNNSLFIYQLQLASRYENQMNWSDKEYSIMQEHSDYLKSLGEKGILVFAGRTDVDLDDKNLLGLVLINVKSMSEGMEIMKKDPGVSSGMQEAKLLPFKLAYRYFQNLND